VARIVSQESSKHMEKVLEEFPPPTAEGGTRICFVLSFIFGLVSVVPVFSLFCIACILYFLFFSLFYFILLWRWCEEY
jgi:hypothetical protein